MNCWCNRVEKIFKYICDALRDLLSFEQFKKREKHPRRSIPFSEVAAAAFDFPPWVFFMFFKLYKWYQIVQSVSFALVVDSAMYFQLLKIDEGKSLFKYFSYIIDLMPVHVFFTSLIFSLK